MNTNRARIFSHVTRTRFLHIENDLTRRKLRFFIGAFEKGQGMQANAYAFLEVDAARVVLSDLADGKPVEFGDYKGGPRAEGGKLIARVLKIQTRAEKYWIEILNGPGERIEPGAIKLVGQPEADVSIPLMLFEGRMMGHMCLAYLRAWDLMFLLRQQHLVQELDEDDQLV